MPDQARILVVQSDPDNLRFLTELLITHGYQVRSSTQGRSILECILSFLPHVVLLDTVLDGTDSYQVCRTLSADNRTAAIPIILTSQAEQSVDTDTVFAAGSADYIAQPFQAAEVLARVKTQLELRLLKEQLAVQSEQLLHTSAAREQSEEKYRALVENINDVIFSVDTRGHFTYISPAIERFAHYSVEQVVGRSFARFVHPDDLPRVVASFGRTLDGQMEPAEFRVLDANGESVCVRTSSRPLVRDGQVVGLTGIMNNITDLANAQLELQRRNRELAAVNRVTSQASTYLDIQSLLQMVTREMVDLFHARNSGITLLNAERTHLAVVADSSRDASYPPTTGMTLPLENNPSSQQVIETMRTVIVPDAQHNPLMDGLHDVIQRLNTACIMIIPLIARNQVIGTIGVDTDEPGRVFTDQEAELARTIATQIAHAVENARLFEQLEQRVQERTAELAEANDLLKAQVQERQQEIVVRQKAEADLVQVNRMLKILSECNQMLMYATEETDLLVRLCRLIVDHGGYPLAWVGYVGQDESRMITPAVQLGFPAGYLEQASLTWREDAAIGALVGRTIRSGEACIARNISCNPEWITAQEEANQFGYASSVTLPLHSPGGVFGALVIYAREPDGFQPEEMTLLSELAGDLAYGILALRTRAEQTQAEEALQRAHDELETRVEQRTAELKKANEQLAMLYQVGQAIVSPLQLERVLDVIARSTASLLGSDTGVILLLDETEQALRIRGAFGLSEQVVQGTRDRIGESIAGRVVQTGEPILANDLPNDARFYNPAAVQEGLLACASVPLVISGRIIGTLDVHSKTDRFAFHAGHIRLLEMIASQAAIALEKARLYDRLQQAHDQLGARVEDRTAELIAANAQLQQEIAERKRAELEIGQRLNEIEAINRISTAMRSAQTLDQMLPSLLDETLRVLDSDAGMLWVYSAAGGASLQPLTRGWPAVIAQAPTALEGVAATVLSNARPFTTREFFSDPVIRPYARAIIPPGWGGACIPIRTSQEIVGILLFSVQLPREVTQSEEHLLTTIAEIAGNAIQRTALHEQTERQLKHLTALQAIDSTITSSFDLHMTLEVVLSQITRQLGVDAADILLLKPSIQALEFAAGRGFKSRAIERVRLRVDQGLPGRAVLERRTVGVPDLASGSFDHPVFQTNEDFRAYFGVPLITKGKVQGVLEVFNRTPIKPSEEWLGFMETFARQAAIAVDNYTLFDNVQRSKDELALAYEETIEGWSQALDMRDKETEGHTQRVTDKAVRLAAAMGLSDAELVHVRRGALLHDIGKMGIPDSILLKRGPLSSEDWVLMRQHPVYAYELLIPIRYLHPAIDIPYCHHERWDGRGYPRGLRGEEIPLAARVFSVVDVYDALSNDRLYRTAWPEWQVRQYLQDESGTRFDPMVVDMFLQMLG